MSPPKTTASEHGSTKTVLWIPPEGPPDHSILVRSALPALLVEMDGWRSAWRASHIDLSGPVSDVAVLPIERIDELSRSARRARSVIIDLGHDRPAIRLYGPLLTALSNRVAAVVARDIAGERWARRLLKDRVVVRRIADPAARPADLDAARLRFGLETQPQPAFDDWPAQFDLWFCEASDRIDANEIDALRQLWSAPGEFPRLAVAPNEVLGWLDQIGVAFQRVEATSARVAEAVRRARECVFPAGSPLLQSRRRALAARVSGRFESLLSEVHHPLNVGLAWADLLNWVMPVARPPGQLLVVLDLVQDLDLMLPLLDEAAARAQPVRILISDWLDRRSPRVRAELTARDVSVQVASRESIQSNGIGGFGDVDAVLAAAESDLPVHARVHSLFESARAAKVPTFSLQHGLENIGLTRIDFARDDRPQLNSDHLLVWSAPGAPSLSETSADLRPRLIHVGRAVSSRSAPPPSLRAALGRFESVVAIFENLHWNRYDEAWRRGFLSDCVQFAAERSDIAVVLKPHHTGLWSVRNAHLFSDWPGNLVLADPTDPFWEPYTAPRLVGLADRVITTPSTVALDAAQACRPVAVAAYGLELPAYQPLPMLQSLLDWRAFVDDEDQGARQRAEFVSRSTLGGDPAGATLDYIAMVAQERRHARNRLSDR